MNLNHQILIFAVMITISLTADAEKVYESVDEKGVIEFSDKPSADAQVKDVETPNVADPLPVGHDEPMCVKYLNEKPYQSPPSPRPQWALH